MSEVAAHDMPQSAPRRDKNRLLGRSDGRKGEEWWVETKDKNYALLHARLGADADLEEVPDGVHGLYKPRLRRLVCPEVRLRVRLREDPRRADEVPRGERKARVAVVLLRSNVLRAGVREYVRSARRT